MATNAWDTVWQRLRSGKHMAVIGAATVPPAPSDLQVLSMNCEVLGTSGSVMDAVLGKLEQLLGEDLLPPEPTPAAVASGSRHRLLGALPGQSIDALFVEACNRLGKRLEGVLVLAFEAIDAADEATVAVLAQVLKRPGWLQLPLLLTVHGTPQGLVTELIYLMCHDEGNDALVEIAEEAIPDNATVTFDWTSLPSDVLRVLRAGSILGATFEAELVARLLDVPLGTVLETLQWAVDAGVPLTDRGEGHFSLPADSIAALQSRILPSLLTFWHARLGDLLSGRQYARSAEPSDLPENREAPDTTVNRPLDRYAELFEPAQRPGTENTEPPAWQEQAATLPEHGVGTAPQTRRPPQTHGRSAPETGPRGDQSRAASHLQAAGRTEAAIEQYLNAVREVIARGDTQRAYALCEQGLQLFNDLPPSSRRALLRAQLLLEKGRLQWHGALLGASFTLQEALASLDDAMSLLPDDAPPEVVEQVTTVLAGICYDLGDQEALQRALDVLTASSHRLVNAGASLLAARLVNDQAAVYIRLGDPVRATHLLSRSRELFEGRLRQNPNDTMAIEELAETDHLLARLPLHIQIRPGQEADACASGLDHAHMAERAYQRLGQRRALARVWETMGRLEILRGQLQAAQERLTAAFNAQRQNGDVTGLARSAAALADLYAKAGRMDDAIALLADSVTLNFEKGSPIGLAFCRHTLEGLVQAAAQTHSPSADRQRNALHELEQRLAQAEAILGRQTLPDDALRST